MACKERAMTGFYLFGALLGESPRLVVGMQRYPFSAHAWVTLNNEVFTDDPEHCELFEPVAEYC